MERTEIGADWLTVTTNPAQVFQDGLVTRYIDAFYKIDWSEREERNILQLEEITTIAKFEQYRN